MAAATTLGDIHANATPLTPTLEFSDGPVASVPVTTGNISIGGVTVKGAPVVGSGMLGLGLIAQARRRRSRALPC